VSISSGGEVRREIHSPCRTRRGKPADRRREHEIEEELEPCRMALLADAGRDDPLRMSLRKFSEAASF
jgi:hypothetical protein